MMGHLNRFSASGVGNLNKNFQKIQIPGGLPGGGGGCLSFDLTDTLLVHTSKITDYTNLYGVA